MKKAAFLLFCLASGAIAMAQTAHYSNHGTDKGIDARWVYGVAVVDYDQDGDDDLYLSTIKGANLLYQNDGEGNFTDVAAQVGLDYGDECYSSGWGDFNNDGLIDVYLATGLFKFNKLYLNKGDGTFEDVSVDSGASTDERCRFVLLADYNRDGFLDIYLPIIGKSNRLYRNNGDGTFTDVIDAVNANDYLIAMGAEFCDYDNDGDPDLYLTHDNDQAYMLYQNDGTGNFTDVSEFAGVNYEGNGMGTSFGDFNNDGWMDIYVSNLYENNLFLNNQDGTFTDIAAAAGVDDYGMGWGLTWLDYNNDGWQDIFLANDSKFSPYPNLLYHNNGDNTFSNASADTPLASMNSSYGAVSADFNNDGKTDIFVGNLSAQSNSELYFNQAENTGNWLKLKLEGTESNRSAIGSRVKVTAGEKSYIQELKVGGGYSCQFSFTLHFGLSEAKTVDEVSIRWPNGFSETYQNLEANKTFKATEKVGLEEYVPPVVTASESSLAKEMSFAFYPNPVKDVLTLQYELKEKKQLQIQLLSTSGEQLGLIFQGTQSKGLQQFTYELPKSFPGGVYYVQVNAGKQSFAYPIMVR